MKPVQILFVNDERVLARSISYIIEQKSSRIQFQAAFTINEARTVMTAAKNPQAPWGASIDLILMKALTTTSYNEEPLTLGLVQELSGWYRGPIIGISSNYEYIKAFRAAGCTHTFNIDFERHTILDLILAIIKHVNTCGENSPLYLPEDLTQLTDASQDQKD